MGKQWKKDGKLANANAKGALISKLAKEITVATKLGGPDPDSNSRLRLAISAAKKESVTKDTIERAIKKGSGDLDGGEIEEVVYEGYGPHQVAVIVECQTDNRNRTASDIRFVFKKHNGQIGNQGSVGWMFDRVCYLSGSLEGKEFDPEEEAIEAGCDEVFEDGEGAWGFYGAPDELNNIQEALTARGWNLEKAELSYKPKNVTEVNDEQRKEALEFIEALDDNEDTYRIHASLNFD